MTCKSKLRVNNHDFFVANIANCFSIEIAVTFKVCRITIIKITTSEINIDALLSTCKFSHL